MRLGGSPWIIGARLPELHRWRPPQMILWLKHGGGRLAWQHLHAAMRPSWHIVRWDVKISLT